MGRQDISVFFQHKLTIADFDARVLTFHDSAANKDIQVNFDFCVGADGSYSNVRRQLMRCVRYVVHLALSSQPPGSNFR